jgi:hypothetical protein
MANGRLPTTKKPGTNEGETAVPLKTSAKQPGTDNGRLPSMISKNVLFASYLITLAYHGNDQQI